MEGHGAPESARKALCRYHLFLYIDQEMQALGDEHNHSEIQGFSSLHPNLSVIILQPFEVQSHRTFAWTDLLTRSPSTQDVMWKFKTRDLKSTNALLKDKRDTFIFQMALIQIMAVSPPKHALLLLRLFKSFTFKVNAKWQIQKGSDKEGGSSYKWNCPHGQTT